jgi:hypothetical protein
MTKLEILFLLFVGIIFPLLIQLDFPFWALILIFIICFPIMLFMFFKHWKRFYESIMKNR